MKKSIVMILIVIVFLAVSCLNSEPVDLSQEQIQALEIKEETIQDAIEEMAQNEGPTNLILEDKFAIIDFKLVSGKYTRSVIQDEVEYIEMIALDKNSFLRIAANEIEQEIYSYNYKSDDFTYLYYLKDELLSKTKFNIDTGAILIDEDGYAELLTIEAQELKQYLFDLLEQSDIAIEDLET
jgi:hypothetical protein